MDKDSKIFVAGHRGMVGSAIVRKLLKDGYQNIITRTSSELDLTRQLDVENFFDIEKPEYVFLAAAKVGGIYANNTYKAEFIYQNIAIATNIVHTCYKTDVKKLLNLGSTCIYPKLAQQPLKEEYLLSGPLEPTNDAYAIAKISAIKLCKHYNQQYGTNFLSTMPTNLYGPHDNFDFQNSHVLPAMIRKFHLAKLLMEGKFDEIRSDFVCYGNPPNLKTASGEVVESEIAEALASIGLKDGSVQLWGTGSAFREFLYVDDLADACVFLMEKYGANDLGDFVNVGTGVDGTIKELASLIREVVAYQGEIVWDSSKPDGTPKKLSDVTRLDALGWKSKTSLTEGVQLAYKAYLNNSSDVTLEN